MDTEIEDTGIERTQLFRYYGILDFLLKITRHSGTHNLKGKRQEIQITDGSIDDKVSDGLTMDVVTDADKSSEQYLRKEIQKKDPCATIVGEENERTIRSDTTAFMFDPLDGTVIFSGRMPGTLEQTINADYLRDHNIIVKVNDFNKYSVVVTYIEDNDAKVQVMYAPETDETIFAIKGTKTKYRTGLKGNTLLQGKVSERENITASYGYVPSFLDEKYNRRFKKVLDAMLDFPARTKRFGYTSCQYETLATILPENHPEKRDIAFFPHVYVWDVAPLLIREAGNEMYVIRETRGKITAKPFDYEDFNIYNKKSNRFKQPFFVVVGNKELVEEFVRSITE